MKINILQPLIPHYRETFFKNLKKTFNTDIYIYLDNSIFEKNNMKKSTLKQIKLKSLIFSKFHIYNPFPLLKNKPNIIILPGELRSLSTWIMLLFLRFSKIKVILWGHGISIKEYQKEEKELSKMRIFFHKLADHVWLYTDKEKNIYLKYISENKITVLNNSINIEEILKLPNLKKGDIINKYKISTKYNLIYCARFTKDRRVDLLLELIEKLKDKDIGFILIGDGKYKPNFSNFKNVYDFGAIYNDNIKHELFTIADLYFQPAWTGLSIVESMAYGKPILTFERSESIFQSVEYNYIENNNNGFIAKNMNEIINFIENITEDEINNLQKNTKNYAKLNLGITKMSDRAKNSIKDLLNEITN